MGTPIPLPKRGGAEKVFRPCLLRPNGWMDEAGTWHGGSPQPRRLCVRWGPNPPPPKGGGAPSTILGPFLLWPNGSKMSLGTKLGLGPGDFVLDGDPAPSPKGSPNFRPIFIGPNGWMDQNSTRHGSRPQPRRLCVTWGPSIIW